LCIIKTWLGYSGNEENLWFQVSKLCEERIAKEKELRYKESEVTDGK
jgi:hypothetical protein